MKATGVDEIRAILDANTVTFMPRAPCLKHPAESCGCILPYSMDLVPCLGVAMCVFVLSGCVMFHLCPNIPPDGHTRVDKGLC